VCRAVRLARPGTARWGAFHPAGQTGEGESGACRQGLSKGTKSRAGRRRACRAAGLAFAPGAKRLKLPANKADQKEVKCSRLSWKSWPASPCFRRWSGGGRDRRDGRGKRPAGMGRGERAAQGREATSLGRPASGGGGSQEGNLRSCNSSQALTSKQRASRMRWKSVFSATIQKLPRAGQANLGSFPPNRGLRGARSEGL
jgi:hypothetical protein